MLNWWQIWRAEWLNFVDNHPHYMFCLIFKSTMPAESLWCLRICLFKENMETFAYWCGMLKKCGTQRKVGSSVCEPQIHPACCIFRAPASQAVLRNVQRWVESVLKSEKKCVSAYLPQHGDRPLFKGQPSIVSGPSCAHPSDITGSVRLRSLQTWLPHVLDF